MSLDYTAVGPVTFTAPTAAIANGTVVQWTCGSPQNQAFLVSGFQVNIITAATSATQTCVLQASDTSGSFSSPTVLGTITIVSGDAAGTIKEVMLGASAGALQPGQRVRVVHTATGTDATLRYGVEIYRAPVHF